MSLGFAVRPLTPDPSPAEGRGEKLRGEGGAAEGGECSCMPRDAVNAYAADAASVGVS
jgi:hypothetical protein